MTVVKFLSDSKGLCGFSVSGHSSADADDNFGRIVCAAVSSAVYMAANTITDVIGDVCEQRVGEAQIYIKSENPSDATRTVLAGLKLHLKELSEQYGKRIKIIAEV